MNEEVLTGDRIHQLAILVKAAIGSSSLDDFSKRSGISVGTLSRLQKGTIKNIPKQKTLEAIIAANPENSITLNDLLEAAGYRQKDNLPEGLPVAHNGRSLPEEIIHRSGGNLLYSAINTALILFLNYFFGEESDYEFTVSKHSMYFQIKDQNNEQNYLGIPAFVRGDDNRTVLTQIMATTILSMQNAGENDYVVVITDSETIFNSLKGVFEKFKGQVLFTRDYCTIESR